MQTPELDPAGPFELEGVNSVPEKPESPPPTSSPYAPRGPQGHAAMESTQADPAPPAGQGQSFMTGDCQILNLHVSNKDQVGPLQAGQLPMASGEAQPQGPATMMGHDSSNYAALLPHQATPGLEMPPSAPNRGRGCDGNQFVGMTGHQASQSSFLNGNRSPSPSETSDDSMTVLMQG